MHRDGVTHGGEVISPALGALGALCVSVQSQPAQGQGLGSTISARSILHPLPQASQSSLSPCFPHSASLLPPPTPSQGSTLAELSYHGPSLPGQRRGCVLPPWTCATACTGPSRVTQTCLEAHSRHASASATDGALAVVPTMTGTNHRFI